MLSTLALALQRTALLLHVALAPFAAPFAVARRPSPSTWTTLVALATIAALLGLAASRARRAPFAAAAIALAVALARIAPFALSGPRGPFVLAVFLVSPLLWIGLIWSARSFAPVSARSGRWARGGLPPIVVGLAVSLLTLGFAMPRLSSRQAALRAVLARDPGDEDAAMAVAATLRRQQDDAGAATVVASCATANPAACACARDAAHLALKNQRFSEVVAIAARARCDGDLELEGLAAEAQVTTGDLTTGLPRVGAVLARDPRNANALYAKALASNAVEALPDAEIYARQAIDAGRGRDAQLLLGLVLMKKGDLQGASAQFGALVALDPNDAKARYDLALCADRFDRYGEAREGYLAALRLDPTLVDARYNLALLTHRFGADDEARHHLARLLEMAPRDPRIPALQQALGAP